MNRTKEAQKCLEAEEPEAESVLERGSMSADFSHRGALEMAFQLGLIREGWLRTVILDIMNHGQPAHLAEPISSTGRIQ